MKANQGSVQYQLRPREKNSFRESQSPSPRRSASSGVRPRDREYQDQDEMFVSVSSPGSFGKKQQSSPQYSHSRNHILSSKNSPRGKLMVMSDRHMQPPEQIATVKQQWNDKRPSGTVRNNPFRPIKDSSTSTSPQLVHQPKQWESADIPQGPVSSQAFLMNNTFDMFDGGRHLSPRKTEQFQQRSSPGSWGRDDSEVRIYNSSSPRMPSPISPSLQTMSHQKSHRESERFTSWRPSQEIPKGTVKGRVATLLSRTNRVDIDSRPGSSKQTRSAEAEELNEDPWIIPSKPTADVSVRDWGEAITAKSDDSEEWDNPSTDWLQRKATNGMTKSEFLESSRINESREESASLNHEKERTKLGPGKEEVFDSIGQPLNFTNDRETDMLMAARKKSRHSPCKPYDSEKGQIGFSVSLHDPEFERRAFPDDDAFGSSFAEFNETNKVTYQLSTDIYYGKVQTDDPEDTFYDAELSAETHVCDSLMARETATAASSKQSLYTSPRAQSQETIDITVNGENGCVKHPLNVLPYTKVNATARINEHECEGPDLSRMVECGSEDSDSDGSRELMNKLESKRDYRILRSSSDRKRKTEKLRKYGEVNSRFKDDRGQGTNGLNNPNLPAYPRTLKHSRYTKEVQDRGAHYEAKSKTGSRRAKIQYNITGSKLARRNDSEDGGQSTKGKRSKARNYARQRAGFVADDIMHSNSSESVESVTLAGVGSDIRVLRSILRRPRRSVSAFTSRSIGEFLTFEEETLDPMQQSGLKMLSATIIPMQAQVRRFLAMRRALTRMWALIVIQAHTRRWIAQRRYKSTLKSAITIQAAVRGHLARDDLDFKHVCAIEIQRVIRGYMSTMKVYEDIYKITVVQSFVRMKQAMDKVSFKVAHVVQLQSVFRGFLVRRRQEYLQICAIAIQSNWRRFYHRLNYQFDLLDIIIVQSVWRKQIAKRKLDAIRKGRLDNAAAVIQSKWRQVLYTSIYVKDMANILVAQSALRRYLARKRARLIRDYWVIPAQAFARGYLAKRALVKHKAARKIQSTWRGFVGYADYMFSIADIVTVQKVARAWLARREANQARKLNMAATTIQSASRVVLSKALKSRVAEVMEMERTGKQLAEKEGRAVISIQASVRRMQTQSAYIAFMAARKIQTFWRCRNLSNAYKYYRAAMKIQSKFRGMKARQDTLILRGEILAATIIQSAWRGFVSYTDYIFTVSDIITVQRAFRGHMARKTKDGAIVYRAIHKRRRINAAATAIQKGCRGLLDRQRYWYTLGCTMQIQSWMRGRLVVLQLRREAKARVTLQSVARRFLAKQEYVQKKFIFMLIQTAEQERSKKIEELIVQEKARNDMDEKRRHNAACTIQRFFISVREEVDQLVRASRRRKNWRKRNSNREGRLSGNDHLLEDAWLDLACDSNLENDSFLAHAIANIGSNLEQIGSGGSFSIEQGKRTNENQRVAKNASRKNVLPPTKSTASAPNEFSKLTGFDTAFYRLPPARVKRMDSRELSDDLELEEAFMDTKIFNAKHRRFATKKRNYKV